MILLIHPVERALGMHGEPIKLPRQADRKITDVYHFLDFAPTLMDDLAHFQCDELAERILLCTERVTEITNEQPAFWRGDHPPLFERLGCQRHHIVIILGGRLRDLGDFFTGRRVYGHNFISSHLSRPHAWRPLVAGFSLLVELA